MTDLQRTFPPSLLKQFVITAKQEIGQNELAQLVNDTSLLDLNAISSYDGHQAATTYAEIQKRLRLYYGRGARGILLRVGQNLWKPILREQDIITRTMAAGLKILPAGWRSRPALDQLARILKGRDGKVTVHTMDLNLLFVDTSSPTTLGLQEPQAVCFVTLGLIRGLLFATTGIDHDVEELSCRAAGSEACEFKIVLSGK